MLKGKREQKNASTFSEYTFSNILRKNKNPAKSWIFICGGSLTGLEPETKGLVKKRMTVDEYLAHQTEEEKADSKQIPSILDSEVEVCFRVHWRLSDELFLFWYIWLKDNTAMVEEFVEEVKTAAAIPLKTRSLL